MADAVTDLALDIFAFISAIKDAGIAIKKTSRQYGTALIVNMLYFSFVMGPASRDEKLFWYDIHTDFANAEVNNDKHAETQHVKEASGNTLQTDLGMAFCFIGLLSFPIFSLMLQMLHRKLCTHVICLSYIMNSILLLCAESQEVFLLSEVFLAIGSAGTTMISPIYVSEIAHDDVRSTLLATSSLMQNTGSLVVQITLSLMPKYSICWLALIPSAIVIICLCICLPESPIFYLRRDNTDAAIHSLRCLRDNSADILKEIEDTKAALKATFSDAHAPTTLVHDFCNKRTLRFCCVVIMLYLIGHFAGFTATDNELSSLLEKLNTSNAAANPFLQCIIYMVGNVTAMIICDRVNRKTALIISLGVCSFALFAFGTRNYFLSTMKYGEGDGITNLYALTYTLFHVLSFNIGIGVFPDMVTTDIFSPRTLTLQLTIVGVIAWPFSSFVDDLLYETLMAKFGKPGTFWTYSGTCVLGALFIHFFLPETQEVAVDDLLMNRNENLDLERIKNQ